MSANLGAAWQRPGSDTWKKLERLVRDLRVREGDAAICAVMYDYGGMSAVIYLAGRGEMSPRRAGELCAMHCGDLMAPFMRDGINEFLEGFLRVGFGREFGHYLREM